MNEREELAVLLYNEAVEASERNIPASVTDALTDAVLDWLKERRSYSGNTIQEWHRFYAERERQLIAKRDLEIKAEAWDEGYDLGVYYGRDHFECCEPNANPYRAQ